MRTVGSIITGVKRRLHTGYVLLKLRLTGPPRVLGFDQRLNARVLKMFGATIGTRGVRIHSPITLHEAERGYGNLFIGDGCIINGNNYFDLSAKITLEEGVSIGPGVIIMTHNRFNHNEYLEEKLAAMCDRNEVVLEAGAGIKAGVLIVMGVRIGKEAVVAGNSLVNRDVPSRTFVAGTPARVLREI